MSPSMESFVRGGSWRKASDPLWEATSNCLLLFELFTSTAAGQQCRQSRLKCMIKSSILMKVDWLESGSKILDNGLWEAGVTLARVFCWAKIPRKHLSLPSAYPLLFPKRHSLIGWSCVIEFVRVASVLLILVWAETARAFCAQRHCQWTAQLQSHFIESPQAIQVPPQRPSRASVKWLQLAACHWCQVLNVKNSVDFGFGSEVSFSGDQI